MNQVLVFIILATAVYFGVDRIDAPSGRAPDDPFEPAVQRFEK